MRAIRFRICCALFATLVLLAPLASAGVTIDLRDRCGRAPEDVFVWESLTTIRQVKALSEDLDNARSTCQRDGKIEIGGFDTDPVIDILV